MGIQTTGCEIIGILKNFKDTDPADSHHAVEWKAPEEQSRGTQEQNVAVEVISTIDEGRPGEHMRTKRSVDEASSGGAVMEAGDRTCRGGFVRDT